MDVVSISCDGRFREEVIHLRILDSHCSRRTSIYILLDPGHSADHVP